MDATIQGYLRAASQLEDVWQQIDTKVDELLLQGLPPWEAYTRMGYALAFVRACRMNVVLVQELLKGEGAANAANAGYLPRVTYDQALALCEHIEPTIEEALRASTNSRYVLPPSTLPLKLGPHIASAYQSLPLSHVRGTMRAAQEIRDWTAGLLAKYELALQAAKVPLPQEVATHLEGMKSELELGDFHLRTGVDMAGQMSQMGQGPTAEELLKKAENFLWEAMESFYKISQLVAMPDTRPQPRPVQRPATPVQSHVQAARPLPKPPAPPEPVAIDLLNQVIAEPAPAPKAPAPPSPDMLSMLNQVTTSPQQRQPESSQPQPEAPGLFDQGTHTPEAKPRVPDDTLQSQPETPGLFDQTTPAPEARPHETRASQPDFTGLLAQDQGASPEPPPVRNRKRQERASQESNLAPADDTFDLLARISGEQQEPHS